MNTYNVVSTPEITGNIGSCTSNSIVVETGYNIWKTTKSTIVTNSCTGEVSKFDSWSLGAFPWTVVILGIIIFWVIIASNSIKEDNTGFNRF